MSCRRSNLNIIIDRPGVRAAIGCSRTIGSIRTRRAATLVELIMGITVMMIVVTLAVSQITRQQRAFNAIASAMDLRARLRDGSDILAADVRGIAPSGDSVIVAADTVIEFFSAIGSSTLCTTPTPNAIILPPDSLRSGRTLSSMLLTPEAGDDVLLFADSAPPAISVWQRARVVAVATVATSTGCPVAAGLLSPTDVAGAGRSYQLAFDPTVTVNVARGAPVRIVRRVRYSVYRAGDRKWYLGYRRCDGVCAAIQPVSGPYESAGTPPITFRYFKRDGSQLIAGGSTADVALVEIVLRASYRQAFRLPGMAAAVSADSMITSIALRN